MAYMTNGQFEVLKRVRTEAQENGGHISSETLMEFYDLVEKIREDRNNLKEKSCKYITERRKTDRNYAR